jgi:hemoglobin
MTEHVAEEEAIGLCVRQFYGAALNDALLGPVMKASVMDWEHHFSTIQDFWSHALLGTERYSGFPYPHVQLPVKPEHFDRWLELFGETAKATLTPDLAGKAIEKAGMMAACFKAGMFPFIGRDGKPSRQP